MLLNGGHESQPALSVSVGPERLILADGLQPFMFRSRAGTLFLQAQFTAPPGFKPAAKNMIPGNGVFGNVLSRDGGRTWSRWLPERWRKTPPFFEGAFVQLADGAILMLEWIAQGPTHKGDFANRLWISRDDLQTVQGPVQAVIRLPQAKTGGFDDGGHPYSGLTFHRTVLELPNGDLLAAVYGWFKSDTTPCPYQPKMCKFRSFLLRSADRGRHWSYVATIAADSAIGQEGFDEPVMLRLSRGPRAGRLICLLRTGSWGCPLRQAVSDDDGASWTRPRPLPFHGVDPDLIEMRDGTLVCSFGWRTKDWHTSRPGYRHGNYLAFSRDQGVTWTRLTRLPFEKYAGVRCSTCYTTVREIAPGRLLAVYDIGRWGHPIRFVAGREVRVNLSAPGTPRAHSNR